MHIHIIKFTKTKISNGCIISEVVFYPDIHVFQTSNAIDVIAAQFP